MTEPVKEATPETTSEYLEVLEEVADYRPEYAIALALIDIASSLRVLATAEMNRLA